MRAWEDAAALVVQVVVERRGEAADEGCVGGTVGPGEAGG